MVTRESKVSIHVLSYGRREYLERSIKSIYKNTRVPFDLVIVDNNFPYLSSVKSYLLDLQSHKNNVTLIFNDINKGIGYGCYQALANSDADMYVKIDSDIEIQTRDWLELLLEAYKALGDLAPKCVLGGTIAGVDSKLEVLGVRRFKSFTIEWLDHIGGALRATPKAIIEDIGYINPNLALHGPTDSLYSARLRRHGYLIGRIRELIGFHIDSTKGQETKYPKWAWLSHVLSNDVKNVGA